MRYVGSTFTRIITYKFPKQTPDPPKVLFRGVHEVENSFLNLFCTKYRGCSQFQTSIKLCTVALHCTRVVCLTLYNFLYYLLIQERGSNTLRLKDNTCSKTYFCYVILCIIQLLNFLFDKLCVIFSYNLTRTVYYSNTYRLRIIQSLVF